MGRRLSYQVVQPCEVPASAVYETLMDVERYPEWMPGVTDSGWEHRGNPDTEQGSIRRIRVHRMTVREHVTDGARPHHHAYTALSGVPAGDYRATIRIDDDSGGCLITWEASFISRIPLVGRLIRNSMRASITKTAVALATEARRRTETS